MDTQTKTSLGLAGGLAAFLGVTAAAAGLGSLSTATKPSLWYRMLKKSPLNPPNAVFGPVWGVLYATMAVSAWRIWKSPDSPDRTRALAWWAAQLGLNTAWSWLFFARKTPSIALVDLAAMGFSIAQYTRLAARVDRPAAWMMAPYLAWVSFAGYLNEEVVRRN